MKWGKETFLFWKNKKEKPTQYQIIEQLFRYDYPKGNIRFLIQLVTVFRPKKQDIEVVNLAELIRYFNKNERKKEIFFKYLSSHLQNKKFRSLFTESGIIKNAGFRKEVVQRIIAKFIPNQPKRDTLEYFLNQIFHDNNDLNWLRKIPKEDVLKLYAMSKITDMYSSPSDQKVPFVIFELLNSAALISQRMSGMALDSEILKMLPEYIDFESPFEKLEKELHALDQIIRSDGVSSIPRNNEHYIGLKDAIRNCEDYIERAFANATLFGLSMATNQILLRVKQQLERFEIIVDFLTLEEIHLRKERSVDLARNLISLNSRKNNIRQLIDDSTRLVAYEITQHTAKTGEQYITRGRTEYFKMLLTASGGGVIVGILCILKLLLGKVETSDFGHAFYYSMNYSIGFIAIYLLHFTLATKQPAMTAATLAKSIDSNRQNGDSNERNYADFAELFSRLFRSQFIAFVGNVIVAFPVAMGIMFLVDYITGINLAEDKALKILEDNSPIHSLAIFHAGIAGIFLFLSGIISGSISNRYKYNNMYFRIKDHPRLKLWFGEEKTRKIAKWFQLKWPAVASNFWFGIFMGSVASVGAFLGLNLDIRHITFASGNFAIGLFGMDFKVDLWLFIWASVGIGVIGFMNFIVSFLLSLGLAFRSRGIPLGESKYVFSAVWAYFKSHPTSFLVPTKRKEVSKSEK